MNDEIGRVYQILLSEKEETELKKILKKKELELSGANIKKFLFLKEKPEKKSRKFEKFLENNPELVDGAHNLSSIFVQKTLEKVFKHMK